LKIFSKTPFPKEFSYNELKVFMILKKLNIDFITQYPIQIPDTINNRMITYYADFFIRKYDYRTMKCNGLDIEVDSEFHFLTKGRIRKDEERDEELKKYGIETLRIREDDLKDEEKLKSLIINKLKELGVKIKE